MIWLLAKVDLLRPRMQLEVHILFDWANSYLRMSIDLVVSLCATQSLLQQTLVIALCLQFHVCMHQLMQ
jgi:hypothetical protein